MKLPLIFKTPVLAGVFSLACLALSAQTASVHIDTTASGRQQTIDGFGTCVSGNEGQQTWWQNLYFNDLQASMMRTDLSPAFKSPYSDYTYNSPWFHNHPALPGPDNNNVRTYTSASDYTRSFAGSQAKIAVMGPDINQNINYFDFSTPKTAGTVAQLGTSQQERLGDFKLFGSLWSPAPWVKVTSGNSISGQSSILPVNGTPWPFIWDGNFSGGKLDVSGTARAEFDDSALGGTGPTSALTQFTRCTAAYLRGFQNTYKMKFYAISIQNELNFEEFYSSCTYQLSPNYLTALKAVRAELNKYPDLAGIKLMGPEDLLSGDAYGLWQYGSGTSTTHKNLHNLQNLAADPTAAAAADFFCIHGYANDGVNAASATPTQWLWWANGWTTGPAVGIPANVKGFAAYGKKSWMTETSGENPAWLSPTNGFPGNGAWSIALRIQQALTAGQQSAWAYWQMTDGNAVAAQTLTDSTQLTNSPKYVAVKHFFRYIRPDAVRVNTTVSGSTNLSVCAFVHDTNQTLTVVMINSSPAALPVTINVPSQPTGIASFRTFTSSDGSYWKGSSIAVTNGMVAATVPGYGVVTLYGAKSPSLHAAIANASQLAVSWGQPGAGFVLESTPSLNPAAWASVTNTNAISNGTAMEILQLGAGARFYRLALP